ncbi:hypothetical protein [Spirosoma pollinicola]|uniref:Bacterial Ig domain-containing protein n=1 Tax=Spirosoma pollinicola TaxID=2057025 RepID=A0A2K8Z8T5_9BACT|nr:hypothetical protein [Spirosoma pollinicola]AUD06239.1 hypothetical protein CWM47_32990 [Spirosoma pollinicola]
MKNHYLLNRALVWLLSLSWLLLNSSAVNAQQSTNTIKYRVTFDASTQLYTVWVVPDYATPNSNNGGANELVSTAQVTLKVPMGFVIQNITDASGTQNWDKNPVKLGPGLSLTSTSGTVFTQDYSPAVLDPAYAYYVIGKAPSESNLGPFVIGTPVALFTFKGNGCSGPIQIMPPGDPFIEASYVAFSYNVPNSFYSSSGQPVGGNQDPLEQFINSSGSAASCQSAPITVAITGPAAGTTVANLNPAISGTATPGSSVTVTGPNGQSCVVVAATPDGSWSCTSLTFVNGPASVTAVASLSGVTGTPVVNSFTIAAPLAPVVVLQLKVMLQGALVGSTNNLMRDDLRSKGFLPLTEPYTAIGGSRFTHLGGGGETMPASVTALNVGTGDAVVDWVFVELRNPSNLSLVVATRSAMVQRDGDVVLASDGVSPLSFSGLTGSSFFVSVKHRNHLGAMTATAIPLSTTGTVVDFTTMTSAQRWNTVVGAFDYEGWEQTTVSGRQALWAGDANHNGKVKYQGSANDLITIFSEVIAAQSTNTNPLYNYDNALGYFFGDVNMDGKVKYQGTANDTSLIFTNVITNYSTLNSGQLYNFDFMLEQIP